MPGNQAKSREKTKLARKAEQIANIELLLRHWRSLQTHIDSGITSQEELNELNEVTRSELLQMIKNPYFDAEYRAKSLTENRQYTQITLSHVLNQLNGWLNDESKAQSKNAKLRRRIIQRLYLDDERVPLEQQANMEILDVAEIQKQWEKAKQELVTLMFGTRGLLKTETAAYQIAPEVLTVAL
jgi:hypothetical protein